MMLWMLMSKHFNISDIFDYIRSGDHNNIEILDKEVIWGNKDDVEWTWTDKIRLRRKRNLSVLLIDS